MCVIESVVQSEMSRKGKITLLNTSDFVQHICASKIIMARPRSIFANTFPHKTVFPELSVTDVSAFLLVFIYLPIQPTLHECHED